MREVRSIDGSQRLWERVNGRQFVVIPAGGGKLGTKSGDAYIAFALPK